MGRRLCKAMVFAAVCLGSPPAPAQIIYKCVAEDGKITYAANPCYGEQWQRLRRHPRPKITARKRTARRRQPEIARSKKACRPNRRHPTRENQSTVRGAWNP